MKKIINFPTKKFLQSDEYYENYIKIKDHLLPRVLCYFDDVYIFENYIKVSSYGNAEKTNKHDAELYCLITSDHRIPIGEYTFWDWED